jgi:hypothetical protein
MPTMATSFEGSVSRTGVDGLAREELRVVLGSQLDGLEA